MGILSFVGLGGVPPIVIELVAIAGLGAAVYFGLEHRGKVEELAKLKASSAALVAKANAEIAKTNSAHAAEVAANQEKLNAATAANNALADQLDQRVRDFDAYRRAHPAVASAPGVPGPARSGECGAYECGDLAVRLASTGDELARSNGLLVASLQACQQDRDSLTGL